MTQFKMLLYKLLGKTSNLFISMCSYRKLIKRVISYKNNHFISDLLSLDPELKNLAITE